MVAAAECSRLAECQLRFKRLDDAVRDLSREDLKELREKLVNLTVELANLKGRITGAVAAGAVAGSIAGTAITIAAQYLMRG